MTPRQLYLQAKKTLHAAGIDSPGEEAALLCRHFLGLTRSGLALVGDQPADPAQAASFLQGVEERKGRRPLQYILGEWDFLGLPLRVGEGVLCPREDTAVVVEALAQLLKGAAAPQGLDLCAGTGAVGLGLLTLCPQAQVQCVELSPQALPYLRENVERFGQGQVSFLQGDVLSPAFAARFGDGSLDFLASNPPYIPTGELPTLQEEVRREPALALDGGGDGLVFYRAILQLWLPKVKPGGILAVEIGEDQGQAVAGLFQAAGLEHVAVKKDLAALDRAVTATVRGRTGRVPAQGNKIPPLKGAPGF